MPADLSELRREMALANRILANEGVLDAFGHVSARHPDDPARYLLSRSRAPELVEPADILEFDLDSRPVVPTDTRLYGERVIHGEIYKARPDVMAVCHHHAPAMMPYAITGIELVPVFHLGATLGTKLPFWDQRDEFGATNLLVIEPDEGRSLARALGPHWTVLMRRHGATVAGTTLRELVFRAVYGCRNAEFLARARLLGEIGPLTVEEIERAGAYNLRPGPVGRAGLGVLGRAAGQGKRRLARSRKVACGTAGAHEDAAAGPATRRKRCTNQREESTMKNLRGTLAAAALLAPLALSVPPAAAQDQLKVAIGQINNWENQAPTLGQDAGFFKKRNLALENVGTQGAGETIQAVISGSADLGAGVGIAGVMRAFSRGAPVRILLPAFTGTGDLYWYVRADSPIKTLKDTTDKHTIAYSTSGSSSNNIVVAFVQELGAKAKPTATGGPPGTLTSVMSGQIDVGWAAPPFGMKEVKEGKIRIVARGSDVPSLRGQTVRSIVVNANALKDKKDAIMRFVQGYREAVDWMYSDPKAIAMYAQKIKGDETLIRGAIKEFHPKDAMQTTEMKDLDGIVRDAVKLKFLDKPLTKEQLAELIQIPPR